MGLKQVKNSTKLKKKKVITKSQLFFLNKCSLGCFKPWLIQELMIQNYDFHFFFKPGFSLLSWKSEFSEVFT